MEKENLGHASRVEKATSNNHEGTVLATRAPFPNSHINWEEQEKGGKRAVTVFSDSPV